MNLPVNDEDALEKARTYWDRRQRSQPALMAEGLLGSDFRFIIARAKSW